LKEKKILPEVGRLALHGIGEKAYWSVSDCPTVELVRQSDLPDGMRRPVSRGMRYAPNVSTCSKHKEKETGNAED
jgi:hypothetical protein